MFLSVPKTKIVSMRNGNKDFDIRIDRQSRWGNQHRMKNESVAERNRVCDENKKDLWRKIRNGSITLDELDALYGKVLGCWCKPKRCHGDDLVEAVEWAHALICKYERIKAAYKRRRKREQSSKNIKKGDGSKQKKIPR